MRKLLASVTLASAALVAPPAHAADAPRLDAFAGYSLLKTEDDSRHGWRASATYNFGRLGVMADVANHYSGLFDDLAYMAGPRLALHGETLTPFVYALGGRVRTQSSISVLGVTISESDTNFAWAVGAGVSLKLSGRFDLRVQGDYFNVRIDGENDGNPRFSAGLGYRFGGK